MSEETKIKLSPEEKQQTEQLKLYFSSLSRRLASYLYFTTDPTMVVLSNMDQLDFDPTIADIDSKVKILPEDSAFFHIVEFPDPAYRPLDVLRTPGWSDWLAVNSQVTLGSLCYYLTQFPNGDYPFTHGENGVVTVPMKRSTTMVDTPICQPIVTSIWIEFVSVRQSLLQFMEDPAIISISLDPQQLKAENDKQFFLPLGVTDREAINLPILDGFSYPSVIEFTKRLKPQQETLQLKIARCGGIYRFWFVYETVEPTLRIMSYQPASLLWVGDLPNRVLNLEITP